MSMGVGSSGDSCPTLSDVSCLPIERRFKKFNTINSRETDAKMRPQRVGIVSNIPNAFDHVRIFENGLEGFAVAGSRCESLFSKGQDIDEFH
jgi:hypothetical protein